MDVTQAKAHYRDKGYVVRRGVVPSRLVEAARTDLHRLVRLQLTAAGRVVPEGQLGEPTALHHDMSLLLDRSVDRYLSALRRGAKMLSVHRLLLSPAIVDAVRELGLRELSVCSEPVMHVNSDQCIIPGGYQGVGPHQDWPSIQGSLDCVVVWVPLLPVDQYRFPLEVVPGSHRLGLVQGEVETHVRRVPRSVCPQDQFVPLVAADGDAVLMSAWTVHQTGVAGSRGLRVACSTRFDNIEEPHFVDRGYPCAYRRSVHRELFTPGFPGVEQVAAAMGAVAGPGE